ncbi:hypothetical protein [Streptomyces malaysiensis]|uniref:hypothetical protein n=1 Tax=Streptomyces malaysiensis TaxID=92644 RepID=UPI00369AF6AB
MAYYPEVQEAPQSMALIWRCYYCGATGADATGVNDATHVIGGDEGDKRVYLRPYCGTCLPRPSNPQDLATAEWKVYNKTGAARTGALWRAADEGDIAGAKTAVHYQCTICGTNNIEDLVSGPPVYAVAPDRDEAACIPCMESHSPAELAEAARYRAAGAPARWQP